MSNDTTPGGLMPSGDDPLIGKIIQDRYRVEKRLGQGGMGAVYLAEHVVIQKKVAIKCLHAGLASNPDVVRRFHNEAVAATAIGHPNIVDVTDMGRFDDGTFFMALEFLQGRDWQDDLDRSGAQPLAIVAHIGIQICDALEAAAAKGIVHRDLKPENIFLIERHGDNNFVKVLDFGISKFHDGIGGSTRTGELMGTPYYMAPEQVRGERDITHVADIYSLGVIFYQALTGSVPFDGNTLPELILKIASQPAPSLKLELPDAPVAMVELIERMLSKNASDRPQKFSEVGYILANFVPADSRMSRGSSTNKDAFNATAVGGSPHVAGTGEPVPDRPKQPTPFPARGPDTNAGGTPGMFGKTALPDPVEKVPQPKSSHATTTSPHAITNAGAETIPTSRAASGSKMPLVAAAVAVLAGAGWFFSRGQPEAAVQPEAPSAEANENKVRVQISTLPPDADLFLDGEPISNPFDGELEKDKKSHQLVAKREGFEDTQRNMVLAAAQRIFIQMEQPGGKAQKQDVVDDVKPGPAPGQNKQGPRPAPASVASPAPAPAPAPAPTPAPAPAPAPAPQPKELKKIF